MQELKNNLNKNEIFRFITTLLVCISPILAIYRCCVYFTLCEVGLIILIAVLILFNRPKELSQPKIFLVVLIYAGYVLITGMLGYLFWGNVTFEIFSRIVRFVFYLFSVCFLGRYYFNFKLAKIFIKIIVVISTIFLLVQMIYHSITGDFIYFVIKDWIYSSTYDDRYYNMLEKIIPFRGSGIFLEPAHYSQYMLISLSVLLYSSKVKLLDFCVAIFATIGIMVSLSLTGIFISILIWFVYLCMILFRRIKSNKKDFWWLITIGLIVLSLTVLIFKENLIYAISRLLKLGGTTSNAWLNRMKSYTEIFESNNIWRILFGNGWGILTSGIFYSSVSFVLNSTGILGLIGLILFWIMLFYYSNTKQKLCLSIFIILSFVTEVGVSFWLIFILITILNIKTAKRRGKISMNKNVYIIYSQFFDDKGENVKIGGEETYLLNLCKVFQECNYVPHIYQFASNSFVKEYENIEVIGIKTKSKKPRKNVRNIVNHIETFIDKKSDLILFASEGLVVPVEDCKVITIQHGIAWDVPNYKSHIINSLKNYIRALVEYSRFEKCTKAVCVDYNFINWYRATFKRADYNKFSVIPNFSALSTKKVKKDEKNIKVIFARRFVERRGSVLFAKVAKEICDKYKNVQIDFAGEGPCLDKMKEITKDCKNISFFSFKANESIDVHSKYDIAVVPTLGAEGTSLSLLEAMSAKCCVLSTNVGGITNILINNYNGLIVNPTEKELMDKLELLINDKDLRERLSNTAYKVVSESFSFDVWKNNWKNLIKEIEKE